MVWKSTLSRAVSIGTFLSGMLAHSAFFQYNTLYSMQTTPPIGQSGASDSAYYFDSVKTGGVYPRLNVVMREGGWSDLALDLADPSGRTFWSINDRGLNVAYEPTGSVYKVFAYPQYHQKIIRFTLNGDSLVISYMDSIKGLDSSTYVVGLPSTKAPTGETALAMNRSSGIPSPDSLVPSTPFGYDFEAIALHNGKFYLGDEYGPFIVEVDSATMTMKREWYPGHGLPNVLARRRANRGMEGLTVTPSGKLVGILQSPMLNPANPTTRDSRVLRVIWLDPISGEVKEFAYIASNKGGARRGRDVKIGSIAAIDETRFLVLEHGNGTFEGKARYWVDIFMIDIEGATNVSLGNSPDPDSTGKKWNGKTLEQLGLNMSEFYGTGIIPVRKTLIAGDLMQHTPWPHSKPEGLSIINDTTIAISNDNDYGMTDYSADGIPHILPEAERVSQIMYIKVPHLRPTATGARLSLLHNNDGESKLLPSKDTLGTTWGGAARFKATLDSLRQLDSASGRQVLVVSSGDNFLAGKEWSASLSLPPGRSYYDALLMDRTRYDAICLGNHDFDFGPGVLSRFISSFAETQPPFLSANLDFSAEDTLRQLAESGRITRSVVITKNNQRFGIIGAITPMLGYISSPGKVGIIQEVATSVQKEIDHLQQQGITQIILISHLQSVKEDIALAAMLDGLDLMVAGGGDDLLGNSGNTLFPGDQAFIGPYPTMARDASGNLVPIVTTGGDYKYVGRLLADFDPLGRLDSILNSSGPVAVRGAYDSYIKTHVEDSVRAYINNLSTTVIAVSQIGLNGIRDSVRRVETNLGNLMADAMLWKASQLAPTYGATPPTVAIQNGGGIRNNSIIPSGNITMAHTFDIAPFANYLTIVPNIPVRQFKEILENAVSRVEYKDGRFAQIAGFSFEYDTARTAQVLDTAYKVVTPGSRIRRVMLNDSTVLINNGQILDTTRTLHIATIDFLARGGDQYPFRKAPIVNLGVSYQDVLRDYLQTGLSGTVSSTQYPAGGTGRIIRLNQEPPVRTSPRQRPGISVQYTNDGLLLLIDTQQAFHFDLFTVKGQRIYSAIASPGSHRLLVPVPPTAETFILRAEEHSMLIPMIPR